MLLELPACWCDALILGWRPNLEAAAHIAVGLRLRFWLSCLLRLLLGLLG